MFLYAHLGEELQLQSMLLNGGTPFLRSGELYLYSESSVVVRNTIAVRILRLSGCNKFGALLVLTTDEKVLHFKLCV
jgi:hypothetical protein